LSFTGMRDRQPIAPSGTYDLVVVARSRTSADSEVVRFAATVAADAFSLTPVPAALDSSKLMREIAPPIGAKALLAGLALGGATAAIASGLRAEDPVKSAYSNDTRAMGVAAGLAIGASLAMVLDKGRTLPENVDANRRTREEFDRAVAEAKAENDRRVAAFTLTLTIAP
jgi:hypothetical protein